MPFTKGMCCLLSFVMSRDSFPYTFDFACASLHSYQQHMQLIPSCFSPSCMCLYLQGMADMVVWLIQRAALGLSLAPFGVEDKAVLQGAVQHEPIHPGMHSSVHQCSASLPPALPQL